MRDITEKVTMLIIHSQKRGLDLKTEDGRFKRFLASLPFAKRTYREFEKEGIVTPPSIA